MSTAAVILFMALLSFAQGGDPCPTHRESSAIPCVEKELSYCLQRNLNHNQATVTFLSGHDYSLNTIVNISNVDTICISGNGSTITCEGQAAGLSFTNVTNLYLENLQVHNCGLMKNNSTASINIMNSVDVTLRDVTIEGSKGTGLILYNTGSQVTIENCTFQNNGRMYRGGNTGPPTASQEFISGRGGGLLLLIGDGLNHSSIVVSNCTFRDNYAVGGGGMLAVVQHQAMGNNITIENSNFTNNECERGGGGLGMIFVTDSKTETKVSENVITVIGCAFDGNRAMYGGGTDFVSTLGSAEFAQTCKLDFHDCLWTCNNAFVGKAMDIALAPWQTFSRLGLLPSPAFLNCRFLNHSDSVAKRGISGRILTVTGFDLQFRGSLHFEQNVGSPIDVTSAVLNFTANSNAQFINNEGLNGGAIAMRGTTVMFTHENSSFWFEGNKARNRGGALYINLYNKHSGFSYETCFIQYKGSGTPVDNNVTFVFRDNYAGSNSTKLEERNRGDSIYLTNLLPCLRKCVTMSGESIDISDALKCIGNVTMDRVPNRRHISTEPHHFASDATTTESDQLCEYEDTKQYRIHKNMNYNSTKLRMQSDLSLHFIPGKNQEIPLKLIDDLCAEVLFHVSVQVVYGSICLDSADLFITDNHFTLYGKSGDSGVIKLSTVGAHEKIQYLNVTLDYCPPGYIHRNDRCICSVNTNTHIKGIQQCNETLFQAYGQNGYWLGYFPTDNNTLASTICPKGFCSNVSYWFGMTDNDIKCTTFSICPEKYLLPSNRSDDVSSYICNANRTGILCGRCKENHSAYYHSVSFACKSDELCHLGWLFYILSELIPVTLFFLVVIYFNISFTSGPLNGVIFFMQAVYTMKIDAENVLIHLNGVSLQFARIHMFICRIFSLNIFNLEELSFCLWQNASALDMLVSRYVTIIYSLLLVFVTVFLIRMCGLRKSLSTRSRVLSLKRSIIHGLSTFLVMSYSECTRVSLMILTCGTATAVGDKLTSTHNRAFYNGEYEYLGPDHLKYALPAIFFTATLVIIPPLLLMTYPLCYKLFALLRIEESKFVQITCKVFPLEKIKPLFDSIQGAFKDQYRFFAGLYFLHRLGLVVTFVYATTFTTFYTITGIQLTYILTVHAICRPYKKPWHNILDALLFSNLAIINAITFFSYQRNGELKRIIQHGLILLPLVYLVLYTTYNIVLRVKHFCVHKRSREERVVMGDNSDHILDALDSREQDGTEDTNYMLLKEASMK